MKFKELQNLLGREVVERAQLELGTTRTINGKKVRRVASDNLRKGLSFSVNGKSINFNTNQLYGLFVHYGVNGTEKNWGSPYSYRNGFVGEKMVESIKRWMKQKGVRVRSAEGGFIKQTDSNKTGLAFAIAKAKKKKGLMPLPFYDIAIGYVLRNKKKLVEEALRKDVEFNLDL